MLSPARFEMYEHYSSTVRGRDYRGNSAFGDFNILSMLYGVVSGNWRVSIISASRKPIPGRVRSEYDSFGQSVGRGYHRFTACV
jgi:hypothetical protein